MNFPIITDSSPEIETGKMIVTIVCALITAGVTVWNVIRSGQMKDRELHYGAQIADTLQNHKAELEKKAQEHEKELGDKTEKYKTELQHLSFLNQAKFGWLHARRTKIIFNAHDRFKAASFWLEQLATETQVIDKATLNEYEKQEGALVVYLKEFSLYFPSVILKGFHDCINQFTRTSHELYTGFQAGNYEGAPETMNLARAKMANVEESFRKMLGATVENV